MESQCHLLKEPILHAFVRHGNEDNWFINPSDNPNIELLTEN